MGMKGLIGFEQLKIPHWFGCKQRDIGSGTLTKEEGDTTKIRITKFSFSNLSRRSSQEGAPHEHLRITYWSDSLVALGWINGEPNRWRQFLRNQV